MANSQQKEHRQVVAENVKSLANDEEMARLTAQWIDRSAESKYTYNFEWLGRAIIQYPQDVVALQELIWRIRPGVIIETGIAHGGSLIFSASMLALLDLCDAMEMSEVYDPRLSSRCVIGVDIDIRPHNRAGIEGHPLSSYIKMIEGSSVDNETIERVRSLAGDRGAVLVCLDSNHTHDHVSAELAAYAPLVTPNSYCVVFDTVIEDMGADMFPNRPWGRGNNPKTAVWEFLRTHPEFEIDREIPDKLQITVAPDGYLRRLG